jgi:hypothetical protein
MKRDDLFPSKYVKCADLKGQPRVVEIRSAVLEILKNQQGQEQRKIVLYFAGIKKAMPLNLTNYDSIAGILNDEETNNWRALVSSCTRVRPRWAARPSIASASGSRGKNCRFPHRPPNQLQPASWRTTLTTKSRGTNRCSGPL